jgi:uncharacterized protein YprB with RNaseH-like and TPR domain
MARDLRDRLRRIQEQNKTLKTERQTEPNTTRRSAGQNTADISFFIANGWEPCGFLVLKREIIVKMHEKLTAEFSPELPRGLAILIPDIQRIYRSGGAWPKIDNFVFFDLETSGLSGGAGTIAFLAAFGRFIQDKNGRSLRITQYLLLDYPGENDFIKALLAEFNNARSIIVSYNGKCFDSQILGNRCLMNRIKPPEYYHADLLHPARRLWKKILPDCSQGTIETAILGIDRTGDIPGAMAPEIWFDFLKTGDGERLTGICDHNCRDISGLASILCAFIFIAHDPVRAASQYRYDIESLAIHWHAMDSKTGRALLRHAAKTGRARAGLSYALALLKAGEFDEAREWLLRTASAGQPLQAGALHDMAPRVLALRALAIDSEHRQKNAAQALSFTEQALKLLDTDSPLLEEFERRLQRVLTKSTKEKSSHKEHQ